MAAATDEGEGRRAVTDPGTPMDTIELVALRGEGLSRWTGQLTRRDGIQLRVRLPAGDRPALGQEVLVVARDADGNARRGRAVVDAVDELGATLALREPMSPPERRLYARARTLAWVHAERLAPEAPGTAPAAIADADAPRGELEPLELSPAGARVALPGAWHPDERVELHLRLASREGGPQQLRVRGRVVRTESGDPPAVVIRFDDTSPAVMDRLADLVDAYHERRRR